MKNIPVTIGFDAAKIIGEMRIDETQLPPGAGYHFALGYRVLAIDGGAGTATKIELLEVGLVADEKFTRGTAHWVASPRTPR